MRKKLAIVLLLLSFSVYAGGSNLEKILALCGFSRLPNAPVPYKNWQGQVSKMLKGAQPTLVSEPQRKRLAVALENALDAYRTGRYDQVEALLNQSGVKLDTEGLHLLPHPDAIPHSLGDWLSVVYGEAVDYPATFRVRDTVVVFLPEVRIKDPKSGTARSFIMETPEERRALQWMAQVAIEEYWHALQFYSGDRPITPLGRSFEGWSLRNPEYLQWENKQGRRELFLLEKTVPDSEWEAAPPEEKKRRLKTWRESALVEADIAALLLYLGAPPDEIDHREASAVHSRYFLMKMLGRAGY